MQHTICQQQKMPVEWFALWMPKLREIGRARPIIELVLIAPITAIKQVFQAVIAAFLLGLVMVNRQQTACVRFRDAAILTGKICPRADLLTKFGIDWHGERLGVLKQRLVGQLATQSMIFTAQGFILTGQLLDLRRCGGDMIQRRSDFVWQLSVISG